MLDVKYRLPVRYRDDRLQVLALDPQRFWAYWDEGEAIVRLCDAYLPPAWKTAPRQLRVRGFGFERVVEGLAESGSAYVEGLPAGACCQVEYGVTVDGRYWPLLAEQVQLPGRGAVSRGQRPDWQRVQAETVSSYSLY